MHDVADFPFADQPHHYAGMTCGDIAEQLLAIHPRADEATEAEVETLVAKIALVGSELDAYWIGGRSGGQIGSTGTWISYATAKGGSRIMHLSPYHNGLIDPDSPPEDPTVLERVRVELERLSDEFAGASGERIPIPTLLRRDVDAFSGKHDKIFHVAPGGEDSFWGSFSHVPLPARHSPAVTKSLSDAFAQIRVQHRHWARIETAIAQTAERARKRFEWLGASTGDTHLISVEETDDGDIGSVATTTVLTVLGDQLRPMDVMLNLRNPPRVDKGEMDGWRVHGRDHKRRAKILDGRDPVDAITVCPLLMRTIASLRPGQRHILRNALLHAAGEIRFGPEEEELEGIAQGIGIKDGHIVGTVEMPRGTWRGRTLQVPQTVLPQTILMALAGKPFSAVIEDPRLDGFVVEKASCDAKGRLNVVMSPMPGVPLRDALAACTA